MLSCTLVLGVLAGSAPAQIKPVDYTRWVKVLETYVDENGRVNYAALQKDSDDLDRFVRQLERVNVKVLSQREQVAFWINAYNALTVKMIVDHYPVRSIRLINFGFPWKGRKKVAQDRYSLEHIEHKILRPLGDPRIHFAINCASIGCPKLPRESFYPDRLEEQLQRETIRFMNDPQKVRLDRASNTLYYSAILEWFAEDFLAVAPDILSYIKRYINDEDRTYIESNPITLKTLSYDWDLNE